ncbi:hypothetical protein CEXT_689981, partial [Caerostris extrusa]
SDAKSVSFVFSEFSDDDNDDALCAFKLKRSQFCSVL